MDFNKIGKILLPVGAALLSIASAIVNNKNQEMQMNKAIEEKVAEALSNHAKEL